MNRLVGMIKSAQDLPGHRVGVIPGTLGAEYCEEHRLQTVSYGSLDDAVAALVDKRIDAILLDAITLQWFDKSHPELPVTEVGPVFDRKSYAFVLPIGSPLRHEINKGVLEQIESGYLDTLKRKYFGDIQ